MLNFAAFLHLITCLIKSSFDFFLHRTRHSLFQITEISEDRRREIEQATRPQSSSKRWMEERSKRITSSHFGEVCKATTRNLTDLAKSLMSPKSLSTVPMRHGLKYESVAIEEFEKINGKTTPSGLIVHPSFPYLAATPDALYGSDSVVEVKCPFAARDRQITPESVPYLTYVGNDLMLKQNHDYFYQVQGQMFCSSRSVCYFCVYTFVDFRIIPIHKDDTFIDFSVMHRLQHFFDFHLRPALVEKFCYRNYNKFF